MHTYRVHVLAEKNDTDRRHPATSPPLILVCAPCMWFLPRTLHTQPLPAYVPRSHASSTQPAASMPTCWQCLLLLLLRDVVCTLLGSDIGTLRVVM